MFCTLQKGPYYLLAIFVGAQGENIIFKVETAVLKKATQSSTYCTIRGIAPGTVTLWHHTMSWCPAILWCHCSSFSLRASRVLPPGFCEGWEHLPKPAWGTAKPAAPHPQGKCGFPTQEATGTCRLLQRKIGQAATVSSQVAHAPFFSWLGKWQECLPPGAWGWGWGKIAPAAAARTRTSLWWNCPRCYWEGRTKAVECTY